MSGHSNTKGQMSYVKQRFRNNLNAGEKMSGAEFEMVFGNNSNMTVLVRTSQLPQQGRGDVEDFGPMGMKFTQHGALENSGEITASCVETITGVVVPFITDLVRNKKYIDVTIRPTPESLNGKSPTNTTCRLEHCKIRCDAIDLATEDVQALVKPNMTIIYNWFEWE